MQSSSSRVELLEQALSHAQTRARVAEEKVARYDSKLQKAICKAVTLAETAKNENVTATARLEEAKAMMAEDSPFKPDEKQFRELKAAAWKASENWRRRRRIASEMELLVEATLHWRYSVHPNSNEDDEDDDMEDSPPVSPLADSVVWVDPEDAEFDTAARTSSMVGSSSCFQLVAARIAADERAAYYRSRAEHSQELLAKAENLVEEAETRATQSEQRVKEARRLLVRVAQRAALLIEGNTSKEKRIQELLMLLASKDDAIAQLQAQLHSSSGAGGGGSSASGLASSSSSSATYSFVHEHGEGWSHHHHHHHQQQQQAQQQPQSSSSMSSSIRNSSRCSVAFPDAEVVPKECLVDTSSFFLPELNVINEFFMTKAIIGSICSLLEHWTRLIRYIAHITMMAFPKAGNGTSRRSRPRRPNSAVYTV